MTEPEDHPTFGEPCEECPDSGPPLMRAEDEGPLLNMFLLANLFKPRHINVALSFSVAGEYHSVESLVRQFRSIEDVPGSESTQQEIIDEMRSAIDAMDTIEEAITKSIETTIRDIIAEHPSIEVRND